MAFLKKNKMNQLKGNITGIQSHEGLSIVKVQGPNNCMFTSLVMDDVVSADWLQTGKQVSLYFKEIEVMISKDPDAKVSSQNRLPCKIQSMNTGVILCQLELLFGETIITSIITSNACRQLDLQENDLVTALIKTNEISVSPDD
jgi:molybdate transport system regulatory protein